MRQLWIPLFAALVAGTTLTACTASTRTSETAGEYVDDTAITSRIKTRLLNDAGLKSFNIGVETYKSEVQLSGFVNSAQQKERAEEIAENVPGVKSVRNDLVVK